MSAAIGVALAELLKVSSGEIKHLYRGSCPDNLEGYGVRDDECPACKAMLAAEKVVWDMNSKIDEASIVESIASEWDGCIYEGIGDDIDIGAAIRRVGEKLLSATRKDRIKQHKLTRAMKELLLSYAGEFTITIGTKRADAILLMSGQTLDGHANSGEHRTAKRLAEVGILSGVQKQEFGLSVTITELGAGLIYDLAAEEAVSPAPVRGESA